MSCSRRPSSMVAGADTRTSCSSARTDPARRSARGATTSPTRSSPGPSRPVRSSRCASTPRCSKASRGSRPSGWRSSRVTASTMPIGRTTSRPTSDTSGHASTRGWRDGLASGPADTYPDPVDHCRVCTWYPMCIDRRRTDDHLSIVAGMRRVDTERLTDGRVPTLAGSGRPRAERRIEDIGAAQLDRLRDQARLQLEERSDRRARLRAHRAGPDGPGPRPGGPPGTVAVGSLLRHRGGPVGDRRRPGVPARHRGRGRTASRATTTIWARTPGGGEGGLRALHRARHRSPRCAPGHACLSLRRLRVGRRSSASCNATRPAWTRWTACSAATSWWTCSTSSARASGCRWSRIRSSRSRRSTCPSREGPVTEAGFSVVAFETWLKNGDQTILDGIADYNRDDCVSTWMLRTWLEERRVEAVQRWPGPAVGAARRRGRRSRRRPSRTGCARSRSESTA